MTNDDALRRAATDTLNVLTVLRHPDPSTLWRLGGQPLEAAYQALKAALTEPNPSFLCEECGRETHVLWNGMCGDCVYRADR